MNDCWYCSINVNMILINYGMDSQCTGQLLWNRWSEEWVVLYDDSTMAWFTVSFEF